MAVLDVTETGFGKRSSSFADTLNHEYQRAFHVYLDAPTDFITDLDLQAAAVFGHPQMADEYPTDPNAIVNRIRFTETDLPTHWLSEVSYSTEGADPDRQSLDPLKEPPGINWGSETYKEAIDEDADGEAILNSAYDSMEGVEVERSRLVLTYEDNVLEFNEDEALDYFSSVNSKDFRGRAPGTWYCREYTVTGRGFKANQAFWRRKIVFVYDPKTTTDDDGNEVAVGWSLRLLDAGMRYLNLPQLRQFPIMDQGRQVPQPVPLDGEGQRLAPGGQPVYLTFFPYKKKDFNAIGGINLNF